MRRLPARLLTWGMALSLAFISGGCSFTYQLDSLFSRQRDTAADSTNSIGTSMPRPQAFSAVPQDAEFAAARAAVSEALAKGGRDASVPWEDPATGARGTVTPLSDATSQGGATCRDFLASYVRDGSEAWLQGEACRGPRGRWDVRHLRPWRRS
jgi:surface antigen